MNNYRIETYELAGGDWKAVAFNCGEYVAERIEDREAVAIAMVSVDLSVWVNKRDSVSV